MDAKLVPLFAAFLLSAAPLAPSAGETVTPAALRAHIAVLASDDYQGRKPGTDGGTKTERYLAQAFAEAGLRPGIGEGWFQPVGLVERKAATATMQVAIGHQTDEIPPQALIAIGRGEHDAITDAPLLFAGSSLATAATRADGTVALLFADTPKGAPSLAERRRALLNAGAVATIAIASESAKFATFEKAYRNGRVALADEPGAIEAVISAEAGQRLLAALGIKAAEAARRGYRPRTLKATARLSVDTGVRRFASNNVVGRIVGSERPEEAVVFLAHWDHLGLCRPEGEADRICNGAVDNASGTAALIEIARGLARVERPKRSIYFLATTAEEMGLLGARAFVAAPPVPRERIVAALNLDTNAIAGKGAPVAIIGRGRAALDRMVDDAARAAGRPIDGDTEANAFLQRQDGWEFAKRGIPAIMVGGAFSDLKLMERFLGGSYHKPDDELTDTLPLDGVAEDATLHIAIGRMLADPARYAWTGGGK